MSDLDGVGVLLIDGRSGSGKTSLAARYGSEQTQILHLDFLYPGWDGLAEGSRSVASVLSSGEYRRYDWAAGEFAGDRIQLDPTRRLVIEGCGALTAANLSAAADWLQRSALGDAVVRSIWLTGEEEVRRARALARDGVMFAPHWERWAAQERAHFEVHMPWEIADEVSQC